MPSSKLHRLAWVAAPLAVACLTAIACTDSSPLAPARVPLVADSTAGMAASASRLDADALGPAIEDALDRVMAAFGRAETTDLRASFAALRSTVADRDAGNTARLDAALATARAAVDQLPADAGVAADRDALWLVLDAVRSRVGAR